MHYDEDYHAGLINAGSSDPGSRWSQPRDMVLKYKRSGSILDIGCSSGGFLSTFDKKNWKLYGIELSADTAQLAREATGGEIFAGDASDALFAPDSFDAITTLDVLEHVYDPALLLSNILKWLKPGGIYFVAVPNVHSWESRVFGSFWYGLDLPRHLFHFSPSSLHKAANRIGFNCSEMFTPRASYAEHSLRYIFSELETKCGLHPLSQATVSASKVKANFAWRVIRKGLRTATVLPLSAAASLLGAGAQIQAVFEKPIQQKKQTLSAA